MLRGAVLLLALANLLFFGWTRGWFAEVAGAPEGDVREPARIQRQVNPDAVQVLPATAARPRRVALLCLDSGPVAEADLPAVEDALRDAGIDEDRWQRHAVDRPGLWLVYMGRFPDEELLARKEAELQRLRVPFEPVQGLPDLQPGLSLGRFNDRAVADETLDRLAQRGVRTARVVTLAPAQRMPAIRIERIEAPAAQALRARPAARGFRPCDAAAG